MENKLTLEHLAPYLPWELKLYTWDGGYEKPLEYPTMIGLKVDSVMQSSYRFKSIYCGNEIFSRPKLHTGFSTTKPILRPLSDLTKEIEHNGEKFVPIDYINGEFSLEIPNKIELQNWVKNRSIHFVLAEWVGIEDLYKLFKLLFQWHFDLHGLIDKGLAVDINTLKGETK